MVWRIFIVLAALLHLTVPTAAQDKTNETGQVFEYPGTVVPSREAEITPLVSGWLNKIHFVPGQYVEKGDVLFEFNQIPTELGIQQGKARLARAVAELHLAEAELQRASQLRERDVTSEVEVLEAEARRDIATATVKELEIDLELQAIMLSHLLQKAPFSGIMSEPFVQENGWQGKEGREIIRMATVTQIDPIRVIGEVPYDVYAERRKIFGTDQATIEGLTLTLVLPDGETFPHEGKFVSGGYAFDEESQKLTVWAEFPNPDLLLRPGLDVTIRSELKQSK